MKKFLLLAGLYLGLSANAQNLELYDTLNQVMVTNQTIVVSGTPGDSSAIFGSADLHADVVLINNTGQDREIKVDRIEVVPHVGTRNYLCWVVCEPNQFNTGDYQVRTSQLSSNVADGDTSVVFNGHYLIDGEDGCSLFKYKFFDVNDPSVYAEVFVRFEHTTGDCSTLSINEKEGAMNNVNIYPNPASSNVTIELENNQGVSSIHVVDMLGKTVKVINTGNQDGVNTVNVNDLNEGFYFVNILSGNKIIQSKKLIVNR